jgi:hypothetical protein
MADNLQPSAQEIMSVQNRTDDMIGTDAPLVFWLAGIADNMPTWGNPMRDNELDKFWRSEPMLSGAVASMAFKIAALDFKLKGPRKTVTKYERILRNADFGGGWSTFIIKLLTDVLTRDNGGFIEILRVDRNNEAEPVQGIAHLDSSRCTRTGDPDVPVVYQDNRFFDYHWLKWFQVATLADMPSAQEVRRGLGFCVVSRVLAAAQYIKAIGIYKREKVSGKRAPGIIFTSGVRRGAVADALNQAMEEQRQEGLSLYTKPIIIAGPDPANAVDAKLIALSGLPDGYNEDDVMKWYIATLAMAFGTDYTEFAPMPGGGLGSATQTKTMASRSRGKGPGLLMELIEHAMNWFVLPSNVEFEFAATDPEAETERINLKFLRARDRNLRVASGEITGQQALQLAVMDGDAPESFMNPGSDLRQDAGIPVPPVTPEVVEQYAKQAQDIKSSYEMINKELLDRFGWK